MAKTVNFRFKKPKFSTCIPIELCAFAFRKKFVRPVQLYVLLKSICDGTIKLSKPYKKAIAKKIGFKTIKSVNNNIKLLMARNWVGYDKTSDVYYIRSYDRVMQSEDMKRGLRATFQLKDIKKMRAFLFGAVLTKLVAYQNWRKTRELERIKGRSTPGSRDRQTYYPIANLAIKKILRISISTAFELKKQAEIAGYIKVKKAFASCFAGHTNLCEAKYKDDFKSAYPEVANRVRVKDGFLRIQASDRVLSNIKLKKARKKSKHI